MLPSWVFDLADAVNALERCVPRPSRPDDDQLPVIREQLKGTKLPKRRPQPVQASGDIVG